MKIEVGKIYVNGQDEQVEIIKKIKSRLPYVGVVRPLDGVRKYENAQVTLFSEDGIVLCGTKGDKRCVVREYNSYDDWEIDTPVVCELHSTEEEYKRHFAGVCPDTGKPMVFPHGRTSWSAVSPPEVANEIWLPEEEEK